MTAVPVDASKLEASLAHFVASEKRAELGKNADPWELTVAALKLAREVAPVLPAFVALVRAVEALADELAVESDQFREQSIDYDGTGMTRGAIGSRARASALGDTAHRLRAAVGAALNPQETER